MSIDYLTDVVVDQPAKYVEGIFDDPIPLDVIRRLDVLSVLSQNGSHVNKKRLAEYLTKNINFSFQDQKVIELCYKIAIEVFKELNPQVGKTIGFESKRDEVSIFSDQPIKHAVILEKKDLLHYHINHVENFDDFDAPLADYICTHTVEQSAGMLNALYNDKNPEFLNKFIQTHVERLRIGLAETDQPYETTIDQFLELIQFNKAYQLFIGSMSSANSKRGFILPESEAGYVMEIAHAKALFIMESLTNRFESLESRRKAAGGNKETLLELKEELMILAYRLDMAKSFLHSHTSLEDKFHCADSLKGRSWMIFERSEEMYKTDLNFAKEMIAAIDEKLKIPEGPRKRLGSEDLLPPSKRDSKITVKKPSKNTCNIL